MSAFITVEGSDGAGKTTQLGYIADWLSTAGIDFVQTREPGGTLLGERLRDILLHNDSEEQLLVSNEAELLLMFAARQQHLNELVIPSLQTGRWVLCDRFTDATYAYQGAGRGIDPERIAVLENWVQGALRPDLTLVLDVDVETGVARSASRDADNGLDGNAAPDRFEQQNLTFKHAVRNCYLTRARAEPERIKVIDSGLTMEAVRAQVVTCLEQFRNSYQSRCRG